MSASTARYSAAIALLVAATTCQTVGPRSPAPTGLPAAARGGRVASGASPSLDTIPGVPIRDSIPLLVDTLGARRPDYLLLQHALVRYRALAADTAIPSFTTPAGLPIRPGDSLAAAGNLRRRLAALGDLDPVAQRDSAAFYSGATVDAVRRFQRRHGLEEDGVIGRETLAQLQVPLAHRVDQIVEAMARIRREPPVDSGQFIIVNVPAFRLLAYDGPAADGRPALAMKVIVGRAGETETPSLVEELRYLDFWPYWNVPRSILTKEIIPALRRDSTYLQRQQMELVRGADEALGDTVTAAVIDGLEADRLRVRQRRGPGNALGRVKFVIPNDSNIYLHDTPDVSLFARARRDFSHGCIRVEHARDLAVWAMRNDARWTADSVDAALAGPDFRRAMLPRPIMVIVEYVTAWAEPDGVVWFVPDIYGRYADPLNGW